MLFANFDTFVIYSISGSNLPTYKRRVPRSKAQQVCRVTLIIHLSKAVYSVIWNKYLRPHQARRLDTEHGCV